MTIGIDARMYGESGNGRYLRNLLIQLRLTDHKNSYVIFCLQKDYDAMRLVLASDKWKLVVADFKWYTLSEQLKFPPLLYREHLDLVHFPHFNVPILYLKKFIVTIHDLTHFTFTMKRASMHNSFTYYLKHTVYSFVFWYAITFSRRIFTVSNYVKKEILKKFNCKASKIIVTYEAAEKPLFVSKDEINGTLKRLHIESPYFLYVGNAHPHKNLEYLLSAFSEFHKTVPVVHLYLVGRENYFWTTLLQWSKTNSLLYNVSYLGYRSDADLAVLYANALGYVFPSLSEGFGLPALEAMSYGCPVICSEITSLPEIAGEAALYIDPLIQESLARAMHTLYSSSDIRLERKKLGLLQVKKFSWEEMGKLSLAAYTT
ncbi:MAG: glycosyltransferase family 4 protein [bacterium]|nr:glycosyltransferase family 4 protein [bacterium]